MKKLLWILLSLLLVVSVTGCGRTGGSDQPASAQMPSQNGASYISAQQAKEIALNHAEKTAEQVKYLEIDSELYERIPHYDVEFTFEGREYEYEIDAVSGAVLRSEIDR